MKCCSLCPHYSEDEQRCDVCSQLEKANADLADLLLEKVGADQ